MDQLIGLLIFFALINIVGRVLKSVAAGQKKSREGPKVRIPEEHGRDLERELTRRIFGEEFAGKTAEAPSRPYEAEPDEESTFDEETVPWPEDELEAAIAAEASAPPVVLPPAFDEARFEREPSPFVEDAGELTEPGDLAAVIRDQKPAIGEVSVSTATPHARPGIRKLLAGRDRLRDAIVLGTVLGPCRSRENMRTPRRFTP